MDRHERLTKVRDEPFTVLDGIRARNQARRPRQIQKDVRAAIAEVRGANHL